ncbi:uncharacterized protein LOC124440084 [Xenia sp. Carnegie-2017]|uniref:uncharacterized protein LOC124440084 n=1 Tax=Xenia sp. Carnegie-2017 TaxID=2897299 RepID=UPI001F037494|nr:uncharacterized protein LOC124440084 [Xenia sp. Carnegie-2017]
MASDTNSTLDVTATDMRNKEIEFIRTYFNSVGQQENYLLAEYEGGAESLERILESYALLSSTSFVCSQTHNKRKDHKRFSINEPVEQELLYESETEEIQASQESTEAPTINNLEHQESTYTDTCKQLTYNSLFLTPRQGINAFIERQCLGDTVLEFGPVNASTVDLWSLVISKDITEKELKIIEKEVTTFKPGWLTDYVIDAFLWSLTEN